MSCSTDIADILRFAATNLDDKSKSSKYSKIVEDLEQDDRPRKDFLMACLLKLGLEVNQENIAVPSLSRLHLSSILPEGTASVMAALQEIITVVDGEEYIKDENDTFHLEKPTAWSLNTLAEVLPGIKSEKTDEKGDDEDRIIDYSTVTKRLIIHGQGPPQSKETPYFNHNAFFANLKLYQAQLAGGANGIGNNILYGEVVTSTNTMLEK